MFNKRVVFIALFIISIAGLAFVQYRYLKIGLNLAGVQFSQKVADAGQDIRSGLYRNSQLTYLLGSVLEKDSTQFNTGLDHMADASRLYLEDFLREKLVDNKIDAEFSFALKTRDSSYYLSSAERVRNPERPFTYPIEVQGYLSDRIGQRLILQLQFPDLNKYFLLQLNGLTLPSLLFLAGIFVAVLWVLRTYYWQQRTITTTHEFINNLTHELRTPVFSISLAAKILREKVTPEQKALTETILQQTNRLSGHIDKVLELGSLERASASVPMSEIDFRKSLNEVCEQFSARCDLEGIVFTYSLPREQLRIKGSVFHLENAVNNLLDNARKYGQDGAIELAASVESATLHIDVTDQGPGIPRDQQEKIFRKYYRIPDGDRQEVRGYGLGLSYVRTIAEKHKGQILVQSASGQGTRISFLLPLLQDGS